MVDSPHSIFPGTDEQDYYRGLVTEAAPGAVRQVAVSKGERPPGAESADPAEDGPVSPPEAAAAARSGTSAQDKGVTA